MAVTDGGFIVGDGSNFTLESGATARLSLGLTIGSDVQAFNAQLKDISDLNLSGNGGKVIAVNSGGTELELADVTASSLAADDLDEGDADVTLSTNNGDITITPQSGKTIILSRKINMDIQTITLGTDITSTTGDGDQISPTNSNILFKSNDNTEAAYTVNLHGYVPKIGEVINLFFDKEAHTNDISVKINFGTDSTNSYLHTGSGTAQYLTFNATGQSASIVCLKKTTVSSTDYYTWAILNAGATISTS